MDDASARTRLDELRTSARGWHTVQLAVLGFIGFCGVLARVGEGDANPGWLQALAGVLVLAALGLACAATVLVAGAAWPVDDDRAGSADDELRRGVARVRRGIGMTFVAVALLALATSSAWWPDGEADDGGAPDAAGGGGAVQVSTRSGTVCGDLASGASGTLALDVAGRRVALALGDVVGLRPVDGCG